MPINEQQSLSCIEINPPIEAKKSIIWLHGLGASGEDFVPMVSQLHLPEELGIRFVFPHAPVMPVTINQGYIMPAWFDILGLSIADKIDKNGIDKSVALVEKLILKEEAKGIASKDIILAGFSQGGVIALTTGLRYSKPLAGLMALSSFLPLVEDVIKHASAANSHIPIFIAHGTEDNVLPYALGQVTHSVLEKAGYPVTWYSYRMPHCVCDAEINDIRNWIIEVTK